MRVEFLCFEGCPHAQAALERLRQVVDRLAPGTVIEQVRVEGDDHARVLGFVGSPSIRIDGVDLEGLTSTEPTMACRLYDGGAPPEWLIEASVLRALRPRHILFMCVANSARSPMAEAVARALAPAGVRISSAGSVPTAVQPEAVEVLSELGIDAAGHRSKAVDDVDIESVDAVVTLCAEEVCPVFPRPVTQLHWPLPDPVATKGSEQDRLDAFRRTRDQLRRRLLRLFPRPEAALKGG